MIGVRHQIHCKHTCTRRGSRNVRQGGPIFRKILTRKKKKPTKREKGERVGGFSIYSDNKFKLCKWCHSGRGVWGPPPENCGLNGVKSCNFSQNKHGNGTFMKARDSV